MSELKDGKYIGKGKGFKHDIVIQAEVKDGKLVNPEIIDEKDRTEKSANTLLDEAKSTSKFEVDAVSGASITSKAFNEALEDIRRQASGEKADTNTETTLKDGTYTVDVKSFKENQGLPGTGKLTMKVTFDNNKISDIEVPEYTDSPVIGGMAFNLLKNRIIDNQSMDVDAISSATVSSNAYFEGVNQAIEQAGGDPKAFANRKLEKHVPENIELHTDLAIIGDGMAGFSAAIEARDQGIKAMLIDAGETYSNSTARAQGFVMGADTDEQKRRGINDSSEHFYEDLMKVYGDEPKVEPKMLKLLADKSASYIKFLEDIGMEWSNVVNIAPKEPRLTKRAHTIKGMGTTLMGVFAKAAKEKGVDVKLGVKVDELIIKDGKVIGLKATAINGDKLTIYAKGVLVAAGSYTASPEMVKKMNPRMKNIEVIVGNGDGSSIRFFNQAKAQIVSVPYLQFMYYYYGASWGDRFPEAIPESPTLPNYDVLSVDGGGHRLASEDDFTFEFTKRCWDNGYQEGYAIYGQKVADKYPNMTDIGLTTKTAQGKPFGYKENTIEDLAKDVGIDPEELKKTVDRYNELCEKGEDEDFGKNPKNMIKIEAPYYILRMPEICTDGYTGAKINEHAQVLDINDNPIPGLYAAGSCADSAVMGIDYYGDGMSLLNCGVFGREAAKDLADKIK
ncbi:FAD-dependent oxidoreductase [Lactobacillus amylovorus]|uniref:FAD-dependent oxidoreductase n=1 Tax=Lactobacillus amylovorus TaxID=1604 RepID=UPI003F8F36A7